jgi:MFS family permease
MLPAARLARERPAGAVWTWGLVAFALASLACALAPSLGVLIAARCAQALGGAAVIAGAIELLASARGSHRAAAPLWGAAGTAGLALGPALGGALTELLSWEAIFILQVPVVALVVFARGARGAPAERGPEGALDLRPEIALALVSAGLTGALFLLVVMLTEGWGRSPLEAAAIVSAMPVATLGARALARRLGTDTPIVAAGAIATAGGLAALGLLPDAGYGWTLVPQALVGAGIALALPGLTERALAQRDRTGRRAAATIAARHAGIVAGVLLLTPIFNAQLETQQEAASQSGTALLLDADLPTETKVALGEAIGARIDAAGGQLPDLRPAFREVAARSGGGAEIDRLEGALAEEVERAATHAFSVPFLGAALFALLALVPLAIRRRLG